MAAVRYLGFSTVGRTVKCGTWLISPVTNSQALLLSTYILSVSPYLKYVHSVILEHHTIDTVFRVTAVSHQTVRHSWQDGPFNDPPKV